MELPIESIHVAYVTMLQHLYQVTKYSKHHHVAGLDGFVKIFFINHTQIFLLFFYLVKKIELIIDITYTYLPVVLSLYQTNISTENSNFKAEFGMYLRKND